MDPEGEIPMGFWKGMAQGTTLPSTTGRVGGLHREWNAEPPSVDFAIHFGIYIHINGADVIVIGILPFTSPPAALFSFAFT